MERTKKQNNHLWGLLSQLKIDSDMKEELVYDVSNGRTKSSKELDIMEFASLINHLEAIKKGMVKPPTKKPVDQANKLRRKILSTCYELKWTVNGKLDYPKIDDFILKYGYLKKHLNKYTEAELPKLITQFETLLKKDYAKG